MARSTTDEDPLAGVSLFQGLSPRERRAIVRSAKELRFPEGRDLAVEGEPGRRFYLVLEGKARVTRGGRTVDTLGPGDYFGEISLIDGGPRAATVTAETPVRTLALASWNFQALLREQPTIALKLLVTMCRRVRDADPTHVRA